MLFLFVFIKYTPESMGFVHLSTRATLHSIGVQTFKFVFSSLKLRVNYENSF